MTKIKRTKLNKTAELEHFLLNIFEEMPNSENVLVEILHSFLPNCRKTITENYAAIEDEKHLCEVSITPQSRKNARWHINHLGVGNCSDEVISRLIKYVMNKYGGDGVETFITFINDNIPELKELFKRGCGFRECAHLELWGASSEKITPEPTTEFKNYDKKYLNQIVELHNEMIFPQFRQALKIDKEDLRRRFNGAVFKKILVDETTHSVEGYFLIFKKNNHIHLELLLSEAFATYYPEVLNACRDYLNDATILVKKYHTSSKQLAEYLTQIEAEKKASYAILVKDYWAPVKGAEKSLFGLSVNVSSPA